MSSSILFMDGFAHYSAGQIGRMYDSVVNPTNIAVGTSFGRSGGYGVKIGQNSSLVANAGSTQMVLGFAFYLSALPASGTWSLCGIMTDYVAYADQVLQNLRVDSNGIVTLCLTSGSTARATSASRIFVGEWNYCEYRVYAVNGTILEHMEEVRINGAMVLSRYLDSSAVPTGLQVTGFKLGQGSGSPSGYSVQFADVLARSVTSIDGAEAFIGDKIIQTLFPASNGTSNDFSVVGAASAYKAVNEQAADLDASYIASSTTGAVQTFVMGNMLSSPADIAGVRLVYLPESLDASRTSKSLIRIGGTDYKSGPYGLTSDYKFVNSAVGSLGGALNPATFLAWTGGDLVSLEAGVTLVS